MSRRTFPYVANAILSALTRDVEPARDYVAAQEAVDAERGPGTFWGMPPWVQAGLARSAAERRRERA